MYMKNYLSDKNDFEEALEDISLINYMTYQYHPPVYGHIIKTKEFTPLGRNFETYVFVLYCEVPNKKILFVSKQTYSSLEECKSQFFYHIENFPFICFSSRYVYVNFE